MKKIGLIFGGPGNEAEVSKISAKNILANFDRKKFKLILIYWDKHGRFFEVESLGQSLNLGEQIPLDDLARAVDVILPIAHGKFGEDGYLQGLLETLKIKYCGCRVLSSALCMDKAVFKTFVAGQNILQTKYKVVDYTIQNQKEISAIMRLAKKDLKLPIYVKPANSGSSVGITKVEKWTGLLSAIKIARRHDSKIVIEQGLKHPREIEVAVLGNERLIISSPGELKLAKDFYDYDDKYKKGEAEQVIPAVLPADIKKEIIKLTERIYRLCDCRGFARIDFFLHNGKIYLNEINTLPGFTDISMYPMLMRNKGLTYKQLINKIIELAY
ncbi:MAG: D-alanine--D-alanine ligase family protein [Patescibacteria group bacterium]